MELVIVAVFLVACGPRVGGDASGASELSPDEREELDCQPCLVQACEAELDACAGDETCACTAACVEQERAGGPGENVVEACADLCNRLEEPRWRRLADCAAAQCADCPAPRDH